MNQQEINALAAKSIRMEIERLNEALASLEGSPRKVGRKPGRPAGSTSPVRKRKGMSAAAKKAASLRMKKYWADRRAKAKKD